MSGDKIELYCYDGIKQKEIKINDIWYMCCK